MNARERLDAFYAGKPVDRLPNLTIVGSVVTRYTGIDLETYCKDGRAMADAAILAANDLSLDYVQIAADLSREAEGYGTELKYTPDNLPTVVKPALDDITEVSRLHVKKAADIPRVASLIDATAYALEKEPNIYPMTAAIGPATVAGNIRGVEDFMVDFYDEPEAVKELLNMATETALDFIRELAKVGAKYMYMPDPVASLLAPATYEEFILPLHQKLYGTMKELGIGGRLHMCGNTSRILPISCHSGAYIIDVDHATDFAEAVKTVGDNCVLNGNIDPVADVFESTPEHTEEAILQCAKLTEGYRAMFMPGCELPTATPLDNIKAIHRALCKIGPR